MQSYVLQADLNKASSLGFNGYQSTCSFGIVVDPALNLEWPHFGQVLRQSSGPNTWLQCFPSPSTWTHPCSATNCTHDISFKNQSARRKSHFFLLVCLINSATKSVWSCENLHFCCRRRTATPILTVSLQRLSSIFQRKHPPGEQLLEASKAPFT